PVTRTPPAVFGHRAHPRKVVVWQAWAIEIKQETDGPPGVGTRFLDVRKFLGRRIESTTEFTEYDPPSTLALKVSAGPIPFRIRQTLEPTDGGTRLTVRAEGEPGGFFRLAEPIVARAAERQLKGDFETLKDLLESRG